MHPISRRYSHTLCFSMLVVVAALLGGTAVSFAQQPVDQGADTAGALGMATGYTTAWNVHDMNALASLFSDNAEFINPLGTMSTGRAAVEAEHTQRHQGMFATSKMTMDTSSVRFITPEIAVVHFQWTVTGATDPKGAAVPPFHGLTTLVTSRSDSKWQIESAQVTFIGTPPGLAAMPMTK